MTAFKRRGVHRYWDNFYDPNTKAFAGRDARSWSKLIAFYISFYASLAVFFLICMWVFYQTLDPRIPKYQMNSSVIGVTPGLGFRPMPTDNLESTLIWFEGKNKSSYIKWYYNLKDYLEVYYTPGKLLKGTASTKKCKYTDYPREHEVCGVDVGEWQNCTKDNFFDYHRNQPCIFLKLNKIYGWIPEYYTDPRELPWNMPLQLKYHITHTTHVKRNTVWISCEGENPADVEFMGPIKYYPEIQGFPGYYFPYKNGEGYLSPLVAVQFLNPSRGIVINVECKAWARNIKHNRQERIGSVHFELLVD